MYVVLVLGPRGEYVVYRRGGWREAVEAAREALESYPHVVIEVREE